MGWLKAILCAPAPQAAPAAAPARNLCDPAPVAGAHAAIERHLREAAGEDPMELALELLRSKAVALHGPEHRLVVAGALVAAYANATGAAKEKARWLADVRRALEAPSESASACACDVPGDGGSARATGQFALAVKGDAALAKRLAAAAEGLASGIGKGSPCCKRTSFLSILQACQFTREHLGADLRAKGPVCEWASQNRRCIQAGCPFFRA